MDAYSQICLKYNIPKFYRNDEDSYIEPFAYKLDKVTRAFSKMDQFEQESFLIAVGGHRFANKMRCIFNQWNELEVEQ
ncbi:protein of unknown function [Ruminococcaceae bacterium BL-6]|nr:protein of unknown function [Ruminococcaceae bacterium BL-6]